MKKVSERALIKRINRRPAHEGERLRKNSDPRWWMDLGWFYTVDLRSGYVEGRHIEPEAYARELGALGPNEELGEAQ